MLSGGSGNDVEDGGTGDDAIAGDDGDDKLSGGAGTDSLSGGAGADTLDGGSGGDTMDGGPGDDQFVVDSAADVVVEAPGGGTDGVSLLQRAGLEAYALAENVEDLAATALSETLTGNAQNNKILGRGGDDTITGGSGDDTLFGGDGNDVISAGEGNDVVEGDAGSDTVTLGPGDDVFMYRRRDGQDVSVDGGDGTDILCLEGKPFQYTVWLNNAKNPNPKRTKVPVAGSKVELFVGRRVGKAKRAKGMASTGAGGMQISNFEFVVFVDTVSEANCRKAAAASG